MAFTDAVFDGWTSLDGIDAIRARDTTDVRRLLAAREAIPVYVGALEPLLKEVAPAVLVDARMRKHEAPQGQCGLAGLTIGLGPGRGISERPRRIADGVLKAIRKWDDRPPR